MSQGDGWFIQELETRGLSRREFAERYLKDRRTVTEIASLLSFSAASGFSHWYRRQYRAAPSTRREKAPPSKPQ